MIQLDDVRKSHRRGETTVEALRGVTTEIEAGSFTFILGPSGSGKSSLLYLLGALDLPTSGRIQVFGEDVTAMTENERVVYRRDRVGFVFQNFNLLGTASALENVLVPFVPSGVSRSLKERASELLTRVGLGDRLGHRPSHLSGGEQQRVAIARALLKSPKLILADEPTGELDSQTGREIFTHLRRMHEEEQTTIVVVTHDPSHIVRGDHILRLKDGRVEQRTVHEGEALTR